MLLHEIYAPGLTGAHRCITVIRVTTDALDGTFLRWLRRQKGIPARQFAADLGISTDYLRNLENGSRQAKRRPDLIKKASHLLGVPPQKLRKVVD